MEKNMLVEKWEGLINSDKAGPVANKEIMAQLLENQEISLTESATVQADMAQYTPILVPAVRRIFPNLLANEIVGVQSLTAPTGYAYALRYAYSGATSASYNGANAANQDRGDWNTDATGRNLDGAQASFDTYAFLVSDPNFSFSASATITTLGGPVVGTVEYWEKGKALIAITTTQANSVILGDVITSGAATATIVAMFQNEAGYNLIFKNYAGPMHTAAGEYLGGDMKTMSLSIERTMVTAQTRKLKAEYTLELAQDLKAVHGLNAEAELINILEYEISAELDRELVDLINTKASKVQGWSYGTNFTSGASGALGTDPGLADGRWEAEKFRTLYTKILREANQIAITSRRGRANFIIASSNVVAALETLSGFMYSAVPGTIKPTLGVAKVGTLDGQFTVYMDTFATRDYVTLGYKGTSAFDTGIIYCPYVPLLLQKVIDPVTFQPKIAFMTRDAIAGNLYGSGNYYRTFIVNFNGSSIGGGVDNGGYFANIPWK